MLVCSHPFSTGLGERARGDAAATRPGAEPVERRVRQSETEWLRQTEWLRHSAHCGAGDYGQRGAGRSEHGTLAGSSWATTRPA
jgi:hypothetical protein